MTSARRKHCSCPTGADLTILFHMCNSMLGHFSSTQFPTLKGRESKNSVVFFFKTLPSPWIFYHLILEHCLFSRQTLIIPPQPPCQPDQCSKKPMRGIHYFWWFLQVVVWIAFTRTSIFYLKGIVETTVFTLCSFYLDSAFASMHSNTFASIRIFLCPPIFPGLPSLPEQFLPPPSSPKNTP